MSRILCLVSFFDYKLDRSVQLYSVKLSYDLLELQLKLSEYLTSLPERCQMASAFYATTRERYGRSKYEIEGLAIATSLFLFINKIEGDLEVTDSIAAPAKVVP